MKLDDLATSRQSYYFVFDCFFLPFAWNHNKTTEGFFVLFFSFHFGANGLHWDKSIALPPLCGMLKPRNFFEVNWGGSFDPSIALPLSCGIFKQLQLFRWVLRIKKSEFLNEILPSDFLLLPPDGGKVLLLFKLVARVCQDLLGLCNRRTLVWVPLRTKMFKKKEIYVPICVELTIKDAPQLTST